MFTNPLFSAFFHLGRTIPIDRGNCLLNCIPSLAVKQKIRSTLGNEFDSFQVMQTSSMNIRVIMCAKYKLI